MSAGIPIQSYATSENNRAMLSKTDWLDLAIVADLTDELILREEAKPLLWKAAEIAPQFRIKAALILIGQGLTEIGMEFLKTGVDRVFIYDYPEFAKQSADIFTSAIGHYIEEYKPSVMLFPPTEFGKLLAAAVSRRLNLPPAFSCSDFQLQPNKDLILPEITDASALQRITGSRPQLIIFNSSKNQPVSSPKEKSGELILCELPDDLR